MLALLSASLCTGALQWPGSRAVGGGDSLMHLSGSRPVLPTTPESPNHITFLEQLDVSSICVRSCNLEIFLAGKCLTLLHHSGT